MKKLTLALLLLLLTGGVVYYLGTIPVLPGTVSVVYSGLSGLLPDILTTPGRHFLWHRLIPGDTEVYTYPEKEATLTKTMLFRLPPGELPVFGRKKEFESEVAIALRVELSAKSPLLLAAAGYKTIETWMRALIEQRSRSLQDLLARTADDAILRNTPPNLSAALTRASEDDFQNKAQKDAALYGIRIMTLDLKAVRLPDPDNYFKMRQSLASSTPEVADRLREHYKNKASLKQTDARNEVELKRLVGIAGLVTKHPGILDYLAVTRLSDKLRLAILPADSREVMKSGVYRKMVEKLLSRLPGAPVNVNINSGSTTTVGTNTRK